jgi:hypothetical protein
LDEKGIIVGLRAKGPAKKDLSGFVINVWSNYSLSYWFGMFASWENNWHQP